MHCVFLIPELLQLIFANFVPEFDAETLTFAFLHQFKLYLPDKKTRSTLLNAALTCRAFNEPALDALWYTMEDLTPLFVLFEGFKVTEDNDSGQTKEIRGHISDSDCKSLCSYAKRVKLLWCCANFRFPPSTSVQKFLEASNWRYLLPCLKYLICSTNLPELSLLPSPNLCVFNATNDGWPNPPRLQDFHALVDSLPKIASRLVGLSLDYGWSGDHFGLVDSFLSLEYLCINDIRPETTSIGSELMQKASSLSRLSRLQIYGNTSFKFKMPIAFPMWTFSVLKMIDLQVHPTRSIKELTGLFRTATFPGLQCLHLSGFDPVKSNSDADDWSDFMKSLVQATTSAVFHSLTFYSEWEDSGITLASISDVLCLHLTKFRMDFLEPLTIEDVRSMGAAWPHLNELHLELPISFDLLVEIAQSFRELHQLNITLNCQTAPDLEDIPMLLSHSLSCFTLCDAYDLGLSSKIFVVLAQCIDRLFPKLENLTVPAMDEEWYQVGTIVRALQVARKDQETRVLGTLSRMKIVNIETL